MNSNYLTIENVSGESDYKVKQDIKFKTKNFVWRVKFNIPLDPSTVNNVNCYVTNLKQIPLKTMISYDSINNYIEIEPIEGYSEDEPYFLIITKNVSSRGGKKLKSDIRIRFKI